MIVTYKEGVTGSSPVAPTLRVENSTSSSMIARLDGA
jgi:hypothetical protein